MSPAPPTSLDTVLAKTVDALAKCDDVPNLGIKVSLVPGQHWLFHPRLLNLRWWWDEQIEYADLVRELIIRAWAHDWHDSCLVTLPESRKFASESVLADHIVGVRRNRNRDTVDAITKLFSLREKIACLVYELSNINWNVNIPPRRVGYSAVRASLNKAATLFPSDVLLQQLRTVFLSLSDEEMETLFEFRNGLVHRIGPDIDDTPQPLFIEIEPGKWDTIPMGKTRARYLLHLALHAWRRLVKGMRELASLPLPAEYLRVQYLPPLDSMKPSELDAIHKGFKVRTEFGEMIIQCMKRCRGFKARLVLPYYIEDGDSNLLTRLSNEIPGRILEAIPQFAPERASGFFKAVLMGNKSRKATIVDTYLTSEYAAERHVTTSEAVFERENEKFRKNIDRIDMVSYEHYIQNAQPFCCWPAVAQQRLKRLLDGDISSQPAISKKDCTSASCTLHVVFRTRDQDETKGLLNVKEELHSFAFIVRREPVGEDAHRSETEKPRRTRD